MKYNKNTIEQNKIINKVIQYKNITKKQRKKIEMFFNTIIRLNIDGIEYDLKNTKFTLKKRKNKYWKPYKAGKQFNYTLCINGQCLKLKQKFILEYICHTCGSKCIILNNFRLMNKLFKNTILYCSHCIQKYMINVNKWRSNSLKNIDIKNNKGIIKFAKPKQSKIDFNFNDMPVDWQNNYWKRNYTENEFNLFLKTHQITHINDVEISKCKKLKYLPYVKTYTGTFFSPKINIDGHIQSINKMQCKCKICGNSYSFHFSKRDTQNHKTSNICRNCMEYYFVNHIWQVRDTKNYLGHKITYQSKLELKFIDFCNENKIEILDGPKIPYFWNNRLRTYSIDFYIPKIDTLVEIKSMHKFHIKDIESGKFQAKCNAANKLVDMKKYSNFIVLYDFNMTNEWKNMFKKQLSIV